MDLRYEASIGEDVSHAISAMVEKANTENCVVLCLFNDIEIAVAPNDEPDAVLEKWNATVNARHEAWLKSPEGIESERRAAEFRRQAESAEAEGILPFEIADKDGWAKTVENNASEYGACVLRYAARWANYMERELANGGTVEGVADASSHEADKEGITGFMYGAAVAILSRAWTHGEELRRWHNLKTQIRGEGEKANESGGVLNPALLRME